MAITMTIMSCVLRANGGNFDVSAFLEKSLFRPHTIFKGDEIRRGRRTSPGFNLDVSHASFSELPRQIEDAVQFLSQHSVELQRLRTFPGVDGIELDFAIEDREVFCQTDCFPSQLLQLAGSLSIDIAVSRYFRPDDSKDRD